MNAKKWKIRIANDNMIGTKFGRWTVISREGSTLKRQPLYKCKCSCGIIKIIGKASLKFKRSLSCGCYWREQHLKRITKHGMYATKVYHAWSSMIQRCYNQNNKKYRIYGGSGIKIYPAWKNSFKSFYNYIGDPPTSKHTIERINGEMGYFPGNIKWATYKEQANNTNRNSFVDFDGKKMTLSQLVDYAKENHLCEYGLTRQILHTRIKRSNKPIHELLSKSIKTRASYTNPESPYYSNLIGMKFYRLTVIKFSHRDKSGRSYFICQCGCGNVKAIQSYLLIKGQTKSCGCFHKEQTSKAKRIDLSGKHFWNWKIVKPSFSKNGRLYYKCQCKCGTIRNCIAENIKSGKSKSCGCIYFKYSKKFSALNLICE